MKLEVTLCYSVLEYCMRNFDPWDQDDVANKIREEMMRRICVIHPDLLEVWETYFKEKDMELFLRYQEFLKSFANRFKILGSYDESENLDQLFENDEIDKRLLYNICTSTEDKILFTDFMDNICKSPHCGVDIFNIDRITDQSEEHVLNMYRLPIANRRIRRGDCSFNLGESLRKFIQKENELIICDNYIWNQRNSDNLFKYLLTHVPKGAKIKVYTFNVHHSGLSDQDIVNIFVGVPFNQWDFEVFLVQDKKDNHARKIITSKYVLNLEKGLASFGTDRRQRDKTDETLLSVSNKPAQVSLPRSRKIL